MPIAKFKDVLYEETGGVATVTLHRPDRLNAIRVGMYEEISEAILHATWNKEAGVIVLRGAGGWAFCVGGDTLGAEFARQGRGMIGVPVEQLHGAIRASAKLIIAKVRGFAIGGNVLVTCAI